MNCLKTMLAGSAVAFGLLLTATAHGQAVPNCNDATMFPNPIYISGSSAFEPTAGNMAIKLSALTGTDKVTLIYKATSSCDGPTGIRDNVTLTGSADYFVPNATNPDIGDKKTCSLDAAVTKSDVGASDIFYENCPGNAATIPDGITDVPGPVQAMIFIVKETNTTNTNLTAEEAQDIWGCGMAGMVEPFTSDITDTQQRNSGSGSQGIVAKAINVPAGSFKGKMNATGGDLVTSLTNAPNPGSAIGFLAADSYDTKRTSLNALAFRAFGQTKAYYADSTADAFDKKNVRDGHYVVTGPEHFFAKYDNATKTITNANAAKFVGWVNGTLATTAFNYIDVEAKAGVVPQCAMKVTRDTDGGYLRPYTPAAPCGCYYESVATKTATPPGCTVCTGDPDCAASGKKCFNKFCE
jgi:ABC-type phosphate transport system substrate-binding protein